VDWQAAILLQTVLVGAGLIALRVLARTKEAGRASFVISAGMYVVLYASMLLVVPWFGHVQPAVVRQYWWRFVGGGMAFALTNVCTYKTLVYFDAVVVAIAGTVNAVFAVIGASLFLDENLSWLQLGGNYTVRRNRLLRGAG
jgi:drug/metabolite transporter (DMT)-like permease